MDDIVIEVDGCSAIVYIAVRGEDGRRYVFVDRNIPRLIDARDRFGRPGDRRDGPLGDPDPAG